MTTSTGGKLLVALAFASMIGGLSIGWGIGEDNGWRRATQIRGWHERDRPDIRGWRDNGGWRDNHGRWHPYRPVYAPPPVVYAPPPSRGISIFFPLFR
jgi:hypothetical protein